VRALCLYAGPLARRHIEQDGLLPQAVCTIPGAAGGPKGLILGPLDRFIFGDWLTGSTRQVHLVGASIGAWRMATACLNDPVVAFAQLEHDYIRQRYELNPGEKRPSAAQVSELFGQNLKAFYAGRIPEVLQHARYRLHIVTARGRHILAREQRWRTPVGYLGALLSNTVQRKADLVTSMWTNNPMRVAFLGSQFRDVRAEDQTLLGLHPLACELNFTCLFNLADAYAVAARLLAFYTGDLSRYSFIVKQDVAMNLNIGSIINLQAPRLDLATGKNFVVVGLTEKHEAGQVTVEVLG